MKQEKVKDKKGNKIQPENFCELVLGLCQENEKITVDFSNITSKQFAKSVLKLFGIQCADRVDQNEVDFFINQEATRSFLKSVGRYCSNDLAIIDKWERTQSNVVDDVVTNNLYYGTDLIFDMEYKRVYKYKDTQHLDQRDIVLSVIKAKVEGNKRDMYLFSFNKKALKYQMVGGYKLEDETSKESMIRHLEDEISDFKYDPKKHELSSVYTEIETFGVSRRTGVFTKYVVDVFLLEGIDSILKLKDAYKWVSIDEIINGISSDGYSILWSVAKNEEEGSNALRGLSLSTDVIQKQGIKKAKEILTPDITIKLINKLILQEESRNLEFKSSIRWDFNTRKVNKDLEKTVLKSLVAFMNTDGGTLILGVNDDKKIIGLKNDIKSLRSKNIDGLIQYITGLFCSYIGSENSRLISIQPAEIEGRTLCLVKIERSNEPVFFTEDEVSMFFVRSGNTTRQLNSKETYKYIIRNWEV